MRRLWQLLTAIVLLACFCGAAPQTPDYPDKYETPWLAYLHYDGEPLLDDPNGSLRVRAPFTLAFAHTGYGAEFFYVVDGLTRRANVVDDGVEINNHCDGCGGHFIFREQTPIALEPGPHALTIVAWRGDTRYDSQLWIVNVVRD